MQVKKESGQGIVEYALILVLVAITIIGGLVISEPFLPAIAAYIAGVTFWQWAGLTIFFLCLGAILFALGRKLDSPTGSDDEIYTKDSHDRQ